MQNGLGNGEFSAHPVEVGLVFNFAFVENFDGDGGIGGNVFSYVDFSESSGADCVLQFVVFADDHYNLNLNFSRVGKYNSNENS